ncbi:hypothetical protein KY289_028692 [Solanum tuberosum]|nr:hypothetical protein KY289_028692 [Solanum tuberosum]
MVVLLWCIRHSSEHPEDSSLLFRLLDLGIGRTDFSNEDMETEAYPERSGWFFVSFQMNNVSFSCVPVSQMDSSCYRNRFKLNLSWFA